jgi:hypothetical protein
MNKPTAPGIDKLLAHIEAHLGLSGVYGQRGDTLANLGMHRSCVSRVRSGERSIPPEWFLAMHEWSGIPVAELRQVAGVESEFSLHPAAIRKQAEQRQREAVAETFAGRKPTPATADFDLPSASDSVEHAQAALDLSKLHRYDWSEAGGYFSPNDGSYVLYDDLVDLIASQQPAAAPSALATIAAQAKPAVIPPIPEMEGLQDIPYALNTPSDWDADYANTWSSLQVAERNKMQWRSHALELRAILAASQQLAAAPSPNSIGFNDDLPEGWNRDANGRVSPPEATTAPAIQQEGAVLDQSKFGKHAGWEYCPECGCLETDPPQEGMGYFCANCGQEWHGDHDYSGVVRANLERLAKSAALASQASKGAGVPDASPIAVTDDSALNGIKWYVPPPQHLRNGMNLYFVPPKYAAPSPAQAQPVADPMNWPLPCDVTVGNGTHKKGVPLRSLVARMKVLHGMATSQPVPDAARGKLENIAHILAQQRERSLTEAERAAMDECRKAWDIAISTLSKQQPDT